MTCLLVLLSSFAFNFTLRHYCKDTEGDDLYEAK